MHHNLENVVINYDYLYNKSIYGNTLHTIHQHDSELCWKIVSNGIVLPHKDVQGEIFGGLLNEKGQYIDGTGVHRGMGQGYDFQIEDVRFYDEDVVFLGLWPSVWGHCLTDNIRRLWVLKDSSFMRQYGHLRFVYSTMYQEEIPSALRDLLTILGAGSIRLDPVNEITQFHQIILPDECFWRESDGTRMFSQEYVRLINQICDYGDEHFRTTSDDKVYFTYRKYPTLRVIGEKKLERFFSESGYRIIAPEEHSFPEQLNILRNCRKYAATAGSLSHNSIFLRDGSSAYLLPRGPFISEYQLALDQVHALNVTYIDTSLSTGVNPDRPWDGPFYYFISSELQDCFDHIETFRNNRLDYYIYQHLGYAMNQISVVPAYYREIYKEYWGKDPDQLKIHPWLARLCGKGSVRKLISRWLA